MKQTKTVRRPVEAQDLYLLQLITDARLSPDGQHIIYGVQRVDQKTEKKYANLWMVDAEESSERQFTQGDQNDASPRWSPDGTTLAFLSTRKEGEGAQVYLISATGGEARRLTDLKGDISEISWSPDGTRLLLGFTKKDQEVIDREADEQKKKLGTVSRHYTRLFYRGDGEGWYGHQRKHLLTVDVATGKTCELTTGDLWDEGSASWSPDSKWIAFCSNHRPDPDLEPDLIDIFVMPSVGGTPHLIPTPAAAKDAPVFSPNGEQLCYVGPRERNQWWQNWELWVVGVDGKSAARSVTREHDISVGCSTLNDVGAGLMMPPVWSADGKVIYFQISQHGRGKLMAVTVDDGTLYGVIDEPGCVGTFTLDRVQETMAYFFGTTRDPGQLWVRDMDTGKTRQVTHLNHDLLSTLDLGEVEDVWFKSRDGDNLQGWILTPPGFDPKKKYPSVLEIHGGPQDQYGYLFMHEFYYLAGQGYVVYFSNPRGGSGYGEEHERAIWGRWGTVDFDDLMDWTDLIAQKPYIDRSRMGVTGGSYGGYMTNWIIGHTHRFAAAATQRSVSNLISMWGTSDLNWMFQLPHGSKPPQESISVLWDRSPVKYLGTANTPTMILHSEMDLRCALEQGQQVFTALKYHGVPSEFVVFPEEPHGLSRTGRTDRRVDRLQSICRWMDTYLKPSEGKAQKKASTKVVKKTR